MFPRPKQLFLVAFLLIGMVLSFLGCQSAPPTAATTPEATVVQTTSTATPQPAPSAAPTSETQPTPAEMNVPPLPPLPTDAALSWGAPLPVLHGAVDDAQALQQTLQTMLSSERALWVAAWPENFPKDLPLPPQGWLVLVTYGRYDVTEEWSLDLDVPADKASWQQAFEEVLQQAGWQKAPNPAFGAFLPSERGEAWCDPQKAWNLTYFAGVQDETHTLAHLIYQHGASQDIGCSSESADMFSGQPKDFPALQAPPGTVPLSGEESGGGPQNWVAHQRFRSPAGLQPLVEAFTEQLVQQGWQLQAVAAGSLWEGEVAFARGHREGDTWPETALLLLGKAPLFDVWLWGSVTLPRPPAPLPPGHLPELHGAIDNPVALRRALALSQWNPLAGVSSVQIWVGEAPDPWPASDLPQPPQAQWESATREVYPDEGEYWTLRFRVPGATDDVQEALEDLLIQAGWQPLALEAFPGFSAGELGFQPMFPEDNLLAHTFCRDHTVGLSMITGPAGEHSVAVTWHYSTGPGPCRQMRASPPDVYPADAVPALILSLASGDTISGGGLSPLGFDFTEGYIADAFWWSDRTPDDQRASFIDQLTAQGWDVRGRGALLDDLVWIQGVQTDTDGVTWLASVVVSRVGEDYFWGVLTVAPAETGAGP